MSDKKFGQADFALTYVLKDIVTFRENPSMAPKMTILYLDIQLTTLRQLS